MDRHDWLLMFLYRAFGTVPDVPSTIPDIDSFYPLLIASVASIMLDVILFDECHRNQPTTTGWTHFTYEP
jgi:hypothetical protein